MLETLQFVFSSFWIWLGTMFLICSFGVAVARISGRPIGPLLTINRGDK